MVRRPQKASPAGNKPPPPPPPADVRAAARGGGPPSGAHGRTLPPPPPAPREKRRPAVRGEVIEASVDPAGWVGARVESVENARMEGGAVFVDVLIDHSGERRLHPVKLVARSAPPASLRETPHAASDLFG